MNQYNTGPYGSFLSPLQIEGYRKPIRQWSNYICMGLLMVHILSIALGIPMGWFYASKTYGDLSVSLQDLIEQSLSLALYILIFWIPTLCLLGWIKIPPSVAFPIRPPRASIVIPGVLIGLGTSVLGVMLSGSLAVVMETAFGLVPTMPDMSSPIGLAPNVIYTISMTLAPAVFEEMLFRGVIMQSLRRFGDGFALVTSAVLFGLIHGNLIQGPNAVLMGLMLGYFVLRTGSLVTGMIIHFTNNALVVVFSYVVDHLVESDQWNSFYMGLYAVYAILGVAALVYLLVRHTGLFRVAPSNYPLSTGKKNGAFYTTVASIFFLLFTLFFICIQFEWA